MGKKVSKKGKGSYAKYRAEARLAKNKEKKAERHQKRLAKFAARKEAGKTYEYKPIDAEKGSKKFIAEQVERAEKVTLSMSHKTEYARFTSNMRKVSNTVEKMKEKLKIEKEKEKKGGRNEREKPKI